MSHVDISWKFYGRPFGTGVGKNAYESRHQIASFHEKTAIYLARRYCPVPDTVPDTVPDAVPDAVPGTFPGTVLGAVPKVPRAVPVRFQSGAATHARDRDPDLAHVPFLGPQDGYSGTRRYRFKTNIPGDRRIALGHVGDPNVVGFAVLVIWLTWWEGSRTLVNVHRERVCELEPFPCMWIWEVRCLRYPCLLGTAALNAPETWR